MDFISSLDFVSILFDNLTTKNYIAVYYRCCLLNKSWYKFCIQHRDNYIPNNLRRKITKSLGTDNKTIISTIGLHGVENLMHGTSSICDVLFAEWNYGKLASISLNPNLIYEKSNRLVICYHINNGNKQCVASIRQLFHKLGPDTYIYRLYIVKAGHQHEYNFSYNHRGIIGWEIDKHIIQTQLLSQHEFYYYHQDNVPEEYIPSNFLKLEDMGEYIHYILKELRELDVIL